MEPTVTPGGSHVIVPWRPDLATLIPHAREFEFAGERALVIPNEQAEARLCRNLGLTVPSPIITRYRWPGPRTPWSVQKTTAALMVEEDRAFVLNTMGTGKTAAAIWAMDYLLQTGKVKKCLIVSTLSTMTQVWENELFALVPHRKWVVVHGDRAKRLRMLDTDADFYIINHHGLFPFASAINAVGMDAVCIDEFAVFRNKSTDMWKGAWAVVAKAKYAWGLTGSPTPMSPTDAWAQVKLLAPNRVPRTFKAFQEQTMKQITTFKWVARDNANDIVQEAMQPSVRFQLNDVMELPETVFRDTKVKLSDEAARAYKMLLDKMRAVTKDGASITAANEGVLTNKLMQVACGYIYTDKGEVFELPNKPRLDALEEAVDECDRKILVFVPYIHAIHGVSAALKKAGHSVAVVHGGVSLGNRNKIFTAFKNAPEPRIIVAHPQCMAHGLTLTEANTVIWYCPHPSLEIYDQANARVVRPGQTTKTLILHLFGTTVERATYTRLRERAKMQGILMDLFRTQELEF